MPAGGCRATEPHEQACFWEVEVAVLWAAKTPDLVTAAVRRRQIGSTRDRDCQGTASAISRPAPLRGTSRAADEPPAGPQSWLISPISMCPKGSPA
jgi:hypothetical protein